jgi:hypothetical protein
VLWVWKVILNTYNGYLGASQTIIIVVIVGSVPNISIGGLVSSSALYSCKWFLLLLGSPLLVWKFLEFPSGGMELVREDHDISCSLLLSTKVALLSYLL